MQRLCKLSCGNAICNLQWVCVWVRRSWHTPATAAATGIRREKKIHQANRRRRWFFPRPIHPPQHVMILSSVVNGQPPTEAMASK